MNARKWLSIVATIVLSLSCSAAFAQGNGHGKGHEKNKHGDDDSGPQVVYSSEQREAVNGWYRLIAPLVGKQPAPMQAWVLAEGAPAFVRLDGPLCSSCPVWRMELAIPAAWPNNSAKTQ